MYEGSNVIEIVEGSREGDHILIPTSVDSPMNNEFYLGSVTHGLNMIPLISQFLGSIEVRVRISLSVTVEGFLIYMYK